MNLRNKIEDYVPYNEQEKTDKKYFLKFMDTFDDVLTRSNIFGHFSVGALVVNKNKTKMLMVYHNIYHAWVWPGGHADGNSDLLAVTIKEVKEETGLDVIPVNSGIFSIQTLPVEPHIKHGKYISSHTHLDVLFLLEADDTIPLTFNKEESKGAKWILLEELEKRETLEYMKPIDQKLIFKLKEMGK